MGYLCPGGKVWARMSLQTDQNNCLHSQIWSIDIDGKVELFLEQREAAFLSSSKICENLNFSTEIQIFANFAGW